MTMSWIWVGLIGISIISAAISGNAEALSAAVPQGAQAGISLAVSMAGSICLWCGVGKLVDRAGFTGFLSRLLKPLLFRLLPKEQAAETFVDMEPEQQELLMRWCSDA